MVAEKEDLRKTLDAAYFGQSPGQIATIKARYRIGVEYAREILGNWQQGGLDIGCNLGHGLSELAGLSFLAIDINEAYLTRALEENLSVRGLAMSGCHLGFLDAAFPVVTMFEVLEHLEGCDQPTLLAEIHRVLRPGGVFVLSTPNRATSGKRGMSPDHKRELNREELVGLLEEQDFEIVEILGQGFARDTLPQRLWRAARDSSLIRKAYYDLLPKRVMFGIRDKRLRVQRGEEIRKPESGETENIFFVVCRRKS